MRAQPEDAGDLTDLYHDAYRPWSTVGLRFKASYQPVPFTKNQITEREIYAVRDKSRVIATVCVQEKSARGIGRHLYLSKLAVAPDYQRRGIAGELLQFAEQVAAQRGVGTIRLDTAKRAKSNLALYRKYDYEVVKEFKHPSSRHRSVLFEKHVPKNK